MCLICPPRKVNFLTFRPPSPPLSYVSPLTLTLLHHTCVSLSPPLPRLTSVQDSQDRRFWLGQRWEVSPSVIIFHHRSFSFCSSTAPDWIPQMSHLRAVWRPPLSVELLGIRADEGLYLPGTSRGDKSKTTCRWKAASEWARSRGSVSADRRMAGLLFLAHRGFKLTL